MTGNSKNGCGIAYVLPNMMNLNPKHSRGSLFKRWETAEQSDFGYIEVPAHFIRNKEPEFTGLNRGGFLTKSVIKQLYLKDDELPRGVKYILHTDPQLSPRCHLEWYNKAWRKRFINMQIDLATHLGFPPSMIEIHPGKKPNRYEDIAKSAIELFETFKDEFNVKPLILIENRSDQMISDGTEMKEFWELLAKQYPAYKKCIGFVVDFRTMYTKVSKEHPKNTRAHFIQHVELIPNESIKGCHIHNSHTKVPTMSDDVPWVSVFNKIKSVGRNLVLNPEVSTITLALGTKQFCVAGLNETKP